MRLVYNKMSSEVQQTYYGWQHGEISEPEDSQGSLSISQVIGHGSISFGRFEIESLSWEKRSVFTHNERQAELEKFKSPGSVAKKKAYFEEYYKKIRALKAMQNQQTELSLEYGADGSISSQNGDDDESAFPSTKPNKMPESISEAPVKDLSVEISIEQERSEAFEYMGPGFLEDATATKTVELYNSEVKEGGSCNSSVQTQISYPKSLVHSLSPGSSEGTNLNEDNHVKFTYKKDTKLKIQSDATALVYQTDSTITDIAETYFVPVDNSVLGRTMLSSHKSIEDPAPAPMPKDPAAKNHSKTVNESITERTKSSLGSKHLLQKSIDEAEIDIALSKKTSCKTRSRDKFSFVASQRSPPELQNKVAVPKPVSVYRERKESIRTGSRDLILRSSKVSARSALGQFYMKGNSRVQEDKREMSTQNTVKSRALQSKSIGHGEFEKNLENKHKTVERRATTEQLKSRSINLPSRNNPDPNGVISLQSESSSCGGTSKKANSLTGRKHEAKGSKLITPFQLSINIKFDSVKQKQVTTSQKHESSFGARKSAIVAKNSRQENPRWR